MKKHDIYVLNPGHFHAALSLRESHDALSDEVHIFAPDGEELETFCAFIKSFNSREIDPTHWNLNIHRGENSLENLLREGRGGIAILAGRNDTKIGNIEKLNRAGYRIFADKPWVPDEKGLESLRMAMGADRPLSTDIMTERFEITTILQKMFLDEPDIFGTFRVGADGKPAIFKESVHHLFKIVNGTPLRRPPWYFDVKVQGEGIVDVTTHLVDMTHWMAFPGAEIDFARDIRLREARRWATRVPLEMFSRITRNPAFPEGVRDSVNDSVLDYFCNGEILYEVRGVPVHLKVIWNLEPPAGAGDTHRSIIRGTRSDLEVRQLAERNYLPEFLIAPHGNPQALVDAVRATLEKHSEQYPGLTLEREGDRLLINVPKALRTTHEQHFCEARNAFLHMLDSGQEPQELRANIVSKYTLLVEARKKAFASPAEPLGENLRRN